MERTREHSARGGIKDSAELFTSDTLKGGAKKPELAKVLCENSGVDVESLMDKFNIDLSLVARLGGHSVPRTHRGKERFPGMTSFMLRFRWLRRSPNSLTRRELSPKQE